MSYNTVILFLLVFSISITFVLSIQGWSHSYYAQETSTEPLKSLEIIKGVFSLFYIKLIPIQEENSNFLRLKGELIINSSKKSPFKFSDKVQIDTYYSRLVKVYIGVSCLEEISQGDYTIKFRLNQEISIIDIFSEIILNVSNFGGNLPNWKPLFPLVQQSGKRIYEIYSNQLLNVDDLSFVFSVESNSENVFIDQLDTVQSYSQGKDMVVYKGIFGINGLNQERDSTTKSIKVRANVKETTKTCYIPNLLNFQVISELPRTFPVDFKEKLIVEKNAGDKQLNSLQIRLTNVVYMSFVSCLAVSSQKKLLSDDDIRNPNKNLHLENSELRLFKAIVSESNFIDINFNGLNRYKLNYSIKCIIETAFSDMKKNKLEQILIGDKLNADKKMALNLSKPEVPQCGFWSFTSQSPSYFGDLALDYCEAIFAKNAYENGIINNRETMGCIQCTKYNRPFTSNEIGICASSIDTCSSNSNYFPTINSIFGSFILLLKNKEKIKENLGIDVNNFKEVRMINDNEDIDYDNIQTTLVGLENRQLKLSLTKVSGYPIECMSTLIPVTQTEITLSDFDDGISLIYAPNNKDNVSSILLPSPPDNYLYNIYMICYNFPGFKNHYKHSSPIKAIIIMNTDKLPPEHKPDEPVDCKTHSFNAKCFTIINQPINLITPLVFPNRSNDLLNYKNLSHRFNQAYIENELHTIKSLIPNTAYLNSIEFIENLINDKDCHKDTSFTECRLEKQKYISDILSKMVIIYTCSNIVDQLTLKTGDISTEDNSRRFAYTLFLLSNNTDAFNKNNQIKFFELTNCFINHLHDLFEIIIETPTVNNSKKDIVTMMLSISANIIELIPFFEVDKIIKANVTTGILEDNYIVEHKKSLEILYTLAAKLKIESFNYKKLHLYFIDKFTTPTSGDDLIIKESKMNITLNPIKLLKKTSSTLIGLFFYDHYITLGFTKKEFASEVVSLRFYQKNSLNDLESIALKKDLNKDLNEAPQVLYTNDESSFDFLYGYRFINSNEFNCISDQLEKDNIEYFLIREGDYGLANIVPVTKGSLFWMIFTFSIIGIILFGGVVYFLYANLRRRKLMYQNELNTPIGY